jgi:purine-binding chemotaxis protein CheW
MSASHDIDPVGAEGMLLISTFSLGGALFGLDTARVQEVVRVADMTPVHRSPAYVVGVMNLRGRIVTVIDLSRKLDMPPQIVRSSSRIYIVEWRSEYVGLLVEEVAEVISASRDRLLPAPENVSGVKNGWIQGIAKAATGLVALLALDPVLEDMQRNRPNPKGIQTSLGSIAR